MIKGNRKLLLGFFFLATSTALAVLLTLKNPAPDFLALGSFVLAQASGILAIVWGNIKEHQANGKAQG
ncbi:MAG TPA: hypothetical protein DDY20_06635 [Desulfobulbaceae bacterium]|nr:hypothetical protein [Desulfobulbaceae bacterium]